MVWHKITCLYLWLRAMPTFLQETMQKNTAVENYVGKRAMQQHVWQLVIKEILGKLQLGTDAGITTT